MIRSAEAYVMDTSYADESWLHEVPDDFSRPEYRHAEPSPFLDDLAERIATICVPQADACHCSTADQEAVLALFADDGHMRPFEEIEADIIRIAVNRYDGRISEVARRLKIGRSTVYRKMEEFGIAAQAKA